MLIIDRLKYYKAINFLFKCMFYDDLNKTFSFDSALSHIHILRLKGNSIIIYSILLYYIILYCIQFFIKKNCILKIYVFARIYSNNIIQNKFSILKYVFIV